MKSNVRYISLFSGIGGLEHADQAPLLYCERDPACRRVLQARHPKASISEDVQDLLSPPEADFVVGGWPCQDLSIAGNQAGLSGKRSGLFFEMLRVAKAANAHTLIGENVPNLLDINEGRDFQTVLDALCEAGYKHVGWRVLNARAFGLPQERRRLFIVASRTPSHARAIHATIPELPTNRHADAFGFYWTGGTRSICFSTGYVPALKIGAADEKGRAPVAVLVDHEARKLSASEFLSLQGFGTLPTNDLAPSTILRMAGNAVALPVGRFVISAVMEQLPASGTRTSFGYMTEAGVLEDGIVWSISHAPTPLASNLRDFLSPSSESLSPQACAGLIVRSVRSGVKMPRELFDVLLKQSAAHQAKLRPSRGDSFRALADLGTRVSTYSKELPTIPQVSTVH